MKKNIFLLIVASLTFVGCGVGETPVETVEVKKDEAAATDTVKGSIENNPNLPPEAKRALLNQGGGGQGK